MNSIFRGPEDEELAPARRVADDFGRLRAEDRSHAAQNIGKAISWNEKVAVSTFAPDR